MAELSKFRVPSRGSSTPTIFFVGEAPGATEEIELKPFVGSSGKELDRMLAEAKIVASDCRFGNVVPWRPPNNDIEACFYTKAEGRKRGVLELDGRYPIDAVRVGIDLLKAELESTKPGLIVALGGTALWALTGRDGIKSWRGSVLDCKLLPGTRVIPTWHPAAILYMWSLRAVAVHDLRRAAFEASRPSTPVPPYEFLVRPDFPTAMRFLQEIPAGTEVSVDIETSHGWIFCVGIATSHLRAACIPILRNGWNPYWSDDEEQALTLELQRILSTCKIIGQNFSYDAQYFFRRMCVIPDCFWDTMLTQHAIYPGTPKDLAHLSSLYCDHHVYWKDEGKEYDPRLHDEERMWVYNCMDAVKTFEIRQKQERVVDAQKLRPQADFLMEMFPRVLRTMNRGVLIRKDRKQAAVLELTDAIAERQAFINGSVGYPINVRSPKQMKDLFYEQLGFPPARNRKTRQITLNEEALEDFATRRPLIRPLVDAIVETRSLGVFLSTFAQAALDPDGRMRCSYNIGGTKTFRLSSSASAFGTGTNLQNVPKGDRSITMKMPNMRSMFVPDPGYMICEVDLAGADAQVVAWEAGDEELKAVFRSGYKIHRHNAKTIFGAAAGPDGDREPYYTYAKQGVHATNYGAKPRTLAKALGITVHEAERFQRIWFQAHPLIKKYQSTVAHQLALTRQVRNKFGFRIFFFDRVEDLLPEALAWIPQSTVAIVINKAWLQMRSPLEVLMQVHDSLVFQVPEANYAEHLRAFHNKLLVPIPYEDPLTIQLGLAVSRESWGDVEKIAWPT